MYVNNISERSSSRVLQQPGGRQSHNIFGGGDDQPEQVQRNGRRGAQQPQSTIGQPSVQQEQAPSASGPQVAAGQRRPEDERQVQRQARSVNNIWGGDEDVQQQKSSTRVNSRPGGDSAGVAGAFSAVDPADRGVRVGAARANQTSDNSPFSTAPMPDTRAASSRAKQVSDDSPFSNQPAPVRSSTRVTHAPGGTSSNILSWQ